MNLPVAPVVVRMNAISSPVHEAERSQMAAIGAQVIEIEGVDPAEVVLHARCADAIQVVGGYLRASVIQQLIRCKIIARYGTGFEKIDVEQATRQGILVTNVPDFCTEEVADHTLALLLASVRQLKTCEAMMRQGQRPSLPLPLVQRLSSLTLGLIGLGNIGQAVAKRALGFGTQVLGYDTAAVQGLPAGVEVVALDSLYRNSDIVSLHCPLTPATRHMIGMQQLRVMKPTAILINTSRGELVNEDELALALQQGIIAYAALDTFGIVNFFSDKAVSTDHPLFALSNVLMTPHVAAHGPEAYASNRRQGAQAVVDALSGKWPRHVVNPQVVPWFPITRTVTDERCMNAKACLED